MGLCRYIHGPPFQGSRSTPHSSNAREEDIERDDTPREGAQTMGCVSIYIHIWQRGVTKQKRGESNQGGPAYTGALRRPMHGYGVGMWGRLHPRLCGMVAAQHSRYLRTRERARPECPSCRVESKARTYPCSARGALGGAITSRWCARWYACAGARGACTRSSGVRASSSGTCARGKTSLATVISPARNQKNDRAADEDGFRM